MEHRLDTSDKIQTETKEADVVAAVELGDVNGKANHRRRGDLSFLKPFVCRLLQLSFDLSLSLSRFFILGVHCQVPVQALVCPLLAVRNGAEEGGREGTGTASGA